MARFIDPRRTVPFVIPADREKPEGERTTFTLGILTAAQWAEAVDTAGERDLIAGAFGVAMLREGLRGWAGGGAPPFAVDAGGKPTPATLDTLSVDDRCELSRAIYRLNRLGDADAGK
jgi:hypothetical protein